MKFAHLININGTSIKRYSLYENLNIDSKGGENS
jgi:hypothetical protein